jgi:ketosteroid isomerase-like protein
MYPPAAATVTGLEAIGNFVDGFLRDPAFTAAFRPLVVDVSTDGTMGFTLNAAELSYTGPDGKPLTEHLRDFHLWRKQPDGSWKLSIDIWNAEPPAAPAHN